MGQSIPPKTMHKGGPPLVATNSSGENKSTAIRKKFETDLGTEIGFAKYLILADRVLGKVHGTHLVWPPPLVGSAVMSEEDSELW